MPDGCHRIESMLKHTAFPILSERQEPLTLHGRIFLCTHITKHLLVNEAYQYIKVCLIFGHFPEIWSISQVQKQ